MSELSTPQTGSPLLDRCPDSLPAHYYFDPAHHDLELKRIWRRNWIYAGRVNDLPAMTVRRLAIAGENLILVKDGDGTIACFHNTCRHRGAELCSAAETRLAAKLIVCPYHAWAYDLKGNLRSTPYVSVTGDFRKEDHGLFKVNVRLWNGLIFICLADPPPDFERVPDLGAKALDHWPMTELMTGRTMVKELACNWKIFWENYNECLHCPGIHPELCEVVPIYGKGYMAANEAPDWTPASPERGTRLKPGARSWTVSGEPCGPDFPGLSEEEKARGQTFVTLYPTTYLVAHVDYVRVVSLRPLGPERTELRAEWLFAKATLEAPGFDLQAATALVERVVAEDGAASEMNQRGLKSSAFTAGRLMPQEYDVFNFQQWVRRQLEG
ncbi:MAG: aromatic ring-hydroxylating dioxygenase subunit alpha [Rhizobiales bacterium]|nr:aromatic ring-hydroxylating dioxygenase subunit alpha [Hyphomicrobiales bacterium]MBI3672452.1 aromatic ring-hydroxylating dioxygenase subunit alpha [Hyphomicrobiales bacterium]